MYSATRALTCWKRSSKMGNCFAMCASVWRRWAWLARIHFENWSRKRRVKRPVWTKFVNRVTMIVKHIATVTSAKIGSVRHVRRRTIAWKWPSTIRWRKWAIQNWITRVNASIVKSIRLRSSSYIAINVAFLHVAIVRFNFNIVLWH